MSDAIRTRLEGVRRKVAENERLTLGPALSEEELDAFERGNGVRLPDDYRLFLQVVGNGVDGESRGFVDVYPIFPLDTWFDDAPGMPVRGNEIRGDLSRPFPHTQGVNYELDGYPEDYDAKEAAASTAPGKIFICDEGCGMYWILVVNGPERGNMWMEDEFGYQPTEPRMGFLEWCERWAEAGWTEGMMDLLSPADEDD